MADLRGENGPLKGMTGDSSRRCHAARDAMQDLAENTEALKRNFLFRGYFNKRGYFDLDDISVAAVSDRVRSRRPIAACSASGSRAPVLFETDANGPNG